MIDKQLFFEEFNKHLLDDEAPSIYFNDMAKNNELIKTYPFNFIFDLVKVEQNLKYHPEGNVWNHTMMVIDRAARSKNLSEDIRVFMWAALLHDIGKTPTTKFKKGKITSYDHDKAGKDMTIQFLKEFNCDEEFIEKVSSLVRWHMQPLFVTKNMRFADLDVMLEDCPVEELALLSTCDRLGRGNLTEDKSKEEEESIKLFLKKVNQGKV